MVTWGRSFAVAFKILLVSVLWYVLGFIVGLVIIAMTGGATLLTALSSPWHLRDVVLNPWSAYTMVIGVSSAIIIGAVIAAVGSVATMVKYIVEEAVREVREARRPAIAG